MYVNIGGQKESWEINTNDTVDVLLQKVSNKINVDIKKVKLLLKGKMLKSPNNKILNKLNIKSNDKLICMTKPDKKKKPKQTNNNNNNTNNDDNKDDSLIKTLDRKKRMEEIRKSAELLAKRKNAGFNWNEQYYFV